MTNIVYLTTYDALLCQSCALDTSRLVNNGRNWLAGLFAVPAADITAVWHDASCEECGELVA